MSPQRLVRRLAHLFARGRFERELDEELADHFERKVAEKLAAGCDPVRARAEARREIGNLTLAREDSRAVWSLGWLEGAAADARHAARWLARHRGFTAAAVLTLGLGIGANTAVWSVARPILLELLPVRDPERLVAVHPGTTSGTREDDAFERSVRIFSVPMFERLREAARRPESGLEDLAAASSFVNAVYWRRGDAAPEAVQAQLASGNYFEVLGVRPSAGRLFGAADDRSPGQHAVAVAAHAFARRALGGERAVEDLVGTELVLGDRSYTVIGVAPPGFTGEIVERRVDLWVPLAMEAELMGWPARRLQPHVMWLRLLGRLRPGREAATASRELTTAFRAAVVAEAGGALSEQAAATLEQQQLELAPLARGLSSVREPLARSLGLLGGVSALVLVIACANVANLLLARGKAREREMAARLALGAPRRRLLRQLLVESALLAALGGALGLLIAAWAGGALLALLVDPGVTFATPPTLDALLLLFCAVVSLVTVLFFGLAPALRATRPSLAPVLRRTASGDGSGSLAGRGLVVVQSGLSLVLLIGAGLFLRSLANLERASPGYRGDDVLVATVDPRGGGYHEDFEEAAPRLAELHGRLLAALEAVPSVASASLSRYPLHAGSGSRTTLYGDGGDLARDEQRHVRYLPVTHAYFETVGLPVLVGRTFDSRDRADTPAVAVVTRELAREFFGRLDAVGRRVGWGPENTRAVEIVGVVEDFAFDTLGDEPAPLLFLSASQDPVALHSVEVRLREPGLEAAAAVRRALEQAAPELPIGEVRALRDLRRDTFRPQRSLAMLLGVFGALALLLSAIGLYGVLAFAIGRRLPELGIRLAIGADRRRILSLVLADAVKLVLAGLIGGAIVSAFAQRWIAGFLFRLAPGDPLAIGAACVVFLAVAALAAYLPARRAARLEPLAVLRHE
jgi:predicted permease